MNLRQSLFTFSFVSLCIYIIISITTDPVSTETQQVVTSHTDSLLRANWSDEIAKWTYSDWEDTDTDQVTVTLQYYNSYLRRNIRERITYTLSSDHLEVIRQDRVEYHHYIDEEWKDMSLPTR